MKKRVFALLTALLFLFSVPVFAEEMPEQRVFDYADLLDEAEEAEIQLWAQDMQENWGMDLAFLTTNDTEGKTVQQYGTDFYIEKNLGPECCDIVTCLNHTCVDEVGNLSAALCCEVTKLEHACALQKLYKISLVAFHIILL